MGHDPVDDPVTSSGDGAQLRERAPGEVGAQVGRGRRDPLLAGVVVELDRAPLDHAVGENGHEQRDARAERHHLRRADRGRLVGRAHDHACVLGEVGEQAAGVVQHLLELAVGAGEELAHLLRLARAEVARLGELVDEEAVALVGGNAPGARVGLGEIALPLEQRHLVADGGRRDAQARRPGHVGRSDRLGRLDVLLDNGPQDGGLAFVQHGWHSRIPSANRHTPYGSGRGASLFQVSTSIFRLPSAWRWCTATYLPTSMKESAPGGRMVSS